MQGCIVTSRFSDIMENREGRLSSREGVIGLLNARLVHPEKLCQEPVLCCSCPLNPVGQATSRSNGASTGLQEAVRLGLGNKKSAPPDDDWWAHQIFIR